MLEEQLQQLGRPGEVAEGDGADLVGRGVRVEGSDDLGNPDDRCLHPDGITRLDAGDHGAEPELVGATHADVAPCALGLDALVGLVPGVGDFATTAVSFYILAAGVRYRVPKVTLLRMALNIAVDYVLGAVPVVGDIFDAAWKSNQKNVGLLRERATVGASEARAASLSDWLFVGLIMLVLLVLLLGSIGFSLWLLSRIFSSF